MFHQPELASMKHDREILGVPVHRDYSTLKTCGEIDRISMLHSVLIGIQQQMPEAIHPELLLVKFLRGVHCTAVLNLWTPPMVTPYP
jgi:hypothetical protein